MKQFRIAFIVCSLSTLSASGHHPSSPTEKYHVNFDRIQRMITDAQSEKAEIKGRLSLLDHSDHHDLYKPESYELNSFRTAKEVLRRGYVDDLTNVRKQIKRLKRELNRLKETR